MKKGFKIGDIINNKAQTGCVGIVIGRKSVGRKYHKDTVYTVLNLNKSLNYTCKCSYGGPDEWLEVVGHFDISSILQPLDRILNETSDRLFPDTKDIKLHLNFYSNDAGNVVDMITKEDFE